jgi:hypothetical protein
MNTYYVTFDHDHYLVGGMIDQAMGGGVPLGHRYVAVCADDETEARIKVTRVFSNHWSGCIYVGAAGAATVRKYQLKPLFPVTLNAMLDDSDAEVPK